MSRSNDTREKLLLQARLLTWAHGYSNVSLREIAQSAGVDVALISRYFGGKRALFEATLQGAFATPPVNDVNELVEAIVRIFVNTPREVGDPSVLQLMVMNARDPEVGEMVRHAQSENMQNTLETLIGDPARAALLMSVILGFSIVEKSLCLSGIPHHTAPEYEVQIRHMITAALNCPVA
jgi:AcrR family transcriptional regulator